MNKQLGHVHDTYIDCFLRLNSVLTLFEHSRAIVVGCCEACK